MKALIIGCGYVGKAVALELAAQGYRVSGLRRSKVVDADLEAAGVAMVQADLENAESLAAIRPDFEWVVNCAAASGGGLEHYRRIYLDGSRSLVRWLEGSPVKAYVYTSSTGVYGQDDGSAVDESSLTAPESDTGKVLVETERLLLDAAASFGFPAIVLRVAGIYGPGRGYWMRQFLSGEPRLEGDGSRALNMVHRDDVAGAVVAALHKGKPGRVYNVVDDEPVSQRALFEWLAARLNKPMPVAGSEATRRTRTATNKKVSNRRLRDDLSYALRYPTFREGYSKELAQ